MAIRAWPVLAAGLVLLAACGTATSGSAISSHSKAIAPVVTVTPDTALIGGQPLQVRLSGFPADATVELYECATGSSCGGAGGSVAVTGSAGSALATFPAQPSVLTGSSTAPTPCTSQCVLVAVAIKERKGVVPKPAPTAAAPLAFATASPASTTELADSSLLDTSFISAAQGWALAAQPCAEGTCARLARTTDGGQHWQLLPNPSAVIQNGTADCAAQACVTDVSFASPAVGYLYGPALLMTTDGGLTWHVQPGLQTETLTIAGGRVYRVTSTSDGCPGPCQPTLEEAPVGSADWRTVIGQVAEPDRSDSAQIAFSGQDALLAIYAGLAAPVLTQAVLYRSADGGATWQEAADPCTGLGTQRSQLIALASAPGGVFTGVCGANNAESTFVITSADGGAIWQPTAAQPHGELLDILAAASPGTIAVASGVTGGGGSYTARLLVTTDGGRHWATAATDPQILTGAIPAALAFETPLAGQWLADPHGIWTTTDGGLHWTRAPFR